MTAGEGNPFEERLATTMAEFSQDVIAAETYTPQFILGRYVTISAMASEALGNREIDFKRRAEVELETATAGLELAEAMGDDRTADTMRAIQEQSKNILELVDKPKGNQPTKKAKPTVAGSSKAKQ